MILTLAIAVGLWAFYWLYRAALPLFDRRGISAEAWARLTDDASALLRRRDALLSELDELEFESALNKVNEADQASLKQRYAREALALDEQLASQLKPHEERLNAELAALDTAQAKAPASQAEVGTSVQTVVPPVRVEPEVGEACAACGERSPKGSRFCDGCGAPLARACPACGLDNRGKARFCRGCGHALEGQA